MGAKFRRCLIGVLLVGVACAAGSAGWATEAQDDRAAVAATARGYLESWYAADAEGIARVLHPDLVKRYVDTLPSGRQVVHSLTRELMVEMTRGGGGSKVPPEERKIEVEVLEVLGDIAVARASSSQYLEYLSLARCNGSWAIVNILWKFRTPQPVAR